MHGGSVTIDAFFSTVNEGVDEMIRFSANEPTVGLFFVQQHAQTSMPYLLDINDKVGAKIHEVTLETEDTKDSICSISTMREHGLLIAEAMVKDINKSLDILSASQSKRWSVGSPSSGAQISKAALQDSSSSGTQSDEHGGSSRSYFSTVFSPAKLKAGFRWPQTDTRAVGTKSDHSTSATPSPAAGYALLPTTVDAESDALPLANRPSDDQSVLPDEVLYACDMSSVLEDYDTFRAEREAKYVEWLGEPENSSKCDEGID